MQLRDGSQWFGLIIRCETDRIAKTTKIVDSVHSSFM